MSKKLLTIICSTIAVVFMLTTTCAPVLASQGGTPPTHKKGEHKGGHKGGHKKGEHKPKK